MINKLLVVLIILILALLLLIFEQDLTHFLGFSLNSPFIYVLSGFVLIIRYMSTAFSIVRNMRIMKADFLKKQIEGSKKDKIQDENIKNLWEAFYELKIAVEELKKRL